MANYLSEDLRIRVIEAVEAGSSRRGAAARFGVSVSSAIRWVDVWRRTGRTAPYPRGGDRRSGRIEGAAEFLLAKVEETPDITLADGPHRALSERRRPAVGTDRGRGRVLAGQGGGDAGHHTRGVAGAAERARPVGRDRHGVAVLRSPWDQLQKKPRTPPSRSALTSPRAAGPGSRANPISIPAGWCSSTRPGPRPKWPACVAARSVANVAVPRSHMDIGRQPPSPPVYAWMA